MLYEDDKALGFGNEGDLTTQPSSGIGVASPQAEGPDPLRMAVDGMNAQPGIGVAPPTAPAAEDPSMMQQIGRALYNYSAGTEGRPSFQQVQEERAQKNKRVALEELKGTVTALEHGVTMRQGMSGDDAVAFDEAYGNKLEAIQPGMKQTFLALTKKPDLLTQFKDYAQYLPEPTQMQMKSDPKGFLHFAGTAEGTKVLMDAKDRFDMRGASKKVQTAMMGYQQLVPKEVAEGIAKDGQITASEVLSMQQYLPKAAQLTETEIGAIQRNDKVFWQGLGVIHGQAEQDVLKRRAEAGDKTKQPPTQKIDGKVYQFDPQNKLTSPRLATDSRYALLGSGTDAEDKGKIFEREFKLSDDYRQDTKKFAERRPLFDSATDYMANRKDEKTSAGDAALMFAYAKMRDPNDRLAVSETRDLVKLGNIFERFGASVSGVLEKGETLPDRVATEMYKEIRRNFTEQNRQQAKVEADFTKKTKDYGGEPSRVVRPYALPEDQLNPKRRDGDKSKGEPKPGGGSNGGTADYADAGAVKTAFDAGKINRAQAKAALKKFGFH